MHTARLGSRLRRASTFGAALVLGAASITEAGPLLPGSVTVPTVLAAPPGTIVSGGGSVTTTALPGSPSLSGVLRTAVIDPGAPGGGLDFYYQVTNNPTSLTSLERLTESLFTGYTVSVFIRPDTFAGFAPPTSASSSPPPFPLWIDRNASGAVVGFQYAFPGLPGFESLAINPGDTSFIVVIRTNAGAFTSGGVAALNGGAITLETFEPFGGAMPEPTSLMLLGSAFALAGGVAHRRARRQKIAVG